jgi:hypothetical protein
MKKIKKLGVAVIVLAMCALLGITVWAADTPSYTYTVEVSDTQLCVSDKAQPVTVTVKADKALDINCLDATIVATGCTVNSVTMTAASETDFVDYNSGTGRFG